MRAAGECDCCSGADAGSGGGGAKEAGQGAGRRAAPRAAWARAASRTKGRGNWRCHASPRAMRRRFCSRPHRPDLVVRTTRNERCARRRSAGSVIPLDCSPAALRRNRGHSRRSRSRASPSFAAAATQASPYDARAPPRRSALSDGIRLSASAGGMRGEASAGCSNVQHLRTWSLQRCQRA